MSNGIKISGLNSGLDTESIVQALVSAKSTKLETAKLAQKKLSWKQDAWKTLNTKVNKFFNGTMSKMKYGDAYLQKTTSVSSGSVASVVTGATAVNGTQKLYVDQLAQTAYLTGSDLGGSYTSDTLLSDLKDSLGDPASGTISVTIDGTVTELALDSNSTIGDFVSKLQELGLNANFDEGNQRFFISSKETGAANDFTISSTGNMMDALGLDTSAVDATKIDAKDAVIRLNGVEFTADTNTFTINGLTITALEESTEEVTLSTANDTSGIYDMIKEFVSGYSELINEMDALYGADSAAKYNMLTDEQKDSMSEDEIAEWDEKIKSALLKSDDVLGTFSGIMKSVTMQPLEIGGESLYLSDFGIGTISYFDSEEFEKNALHIDGNDDDDYTSGNTDKLSALIASDPEKVTSFFTEFTRSLYSQMNSAMARTELSSSFTVYNDLQMQSEYSDYTSKIAEYEIELADYEDKYYAKFSAMEVALAKLQSNTDAVTSLLGS